MMESRLTASGAKPHHAGDQSEVSAERETGASTGLTRENVPSVPFGSTKSLCFGILRPILITADE